MSRVKILVIDDEDGVRQTICENLAYSGYDVSQAQNGEEGLRMIVENLPHIMITDIIMPQKEGLETIIEVRKKFPAVKIIAISGGGRTRALDFLELAEKLGASAILPKPLDLDELEKTIQKLI